MAVGRRCRSLSFGRRGTDALWTGGRWPGVVPATDSWILAVWTPSPRSPGFQAIVFGRLLDGQRMESSFRMRHETRPLIPPALPESSWLDLPSASGGRESESACSGTLGRASRTVRAEYTVVPTLDVDSAYAFRERAVRAETSVRDVLRGQWGQAGRRLRVAVDGHMIPRHLSPGRGGARSRGLTQWFFFLLAAFGSHDKGLPASPALADLMKRLDRLDDHVGWHPGMRHRTRKRPPTPVLPRHGWPTSAASPPALPAHGPSGPVDNCSL